MSHLYLFGTPTNVNKVVDSEDVFWGILGNADISKCTLYYHNIAAICKSSSSNSILLFKEMQGCFDFTVWGTVCHNQSLETCLERLAGARLGEKPLGAKFIGTSRPNDTNANFVTYFEIYYSEKFIKKVICGNNLAILDIEEFQNLCAYFPEDVSPLLRKTSQSIYGLFSSDGQLMKTS